MTDFTVDPVIASLTEPLADWPLSRVFLYNDARYHWGLLVPRRTGAVEIADLSPDDQAQLMAEIVKLSGLVRALHVHVIGRRNGDPAWPGPVWGHSAPEPWPVPAEAPLALSPVACR